MAKAGQIGGGIMMGDLKGNVSKEQRKAFSEGEEYGKSKGSKEFDELLEDYFDLLAFTKDSMIVLQTLGNGVGEDRLDDCFGEGFKDIYNSVVTHGVAMTEDLPDFEDECDEDCDVCENCECCEDHCECE